MRSVGHLSRRALQPGSCPEQGPPAALQRPRSGSIDTSAPTASAAAAAADGAGRPAAASDDAAPPDALAGRVTFGACAAVATDKPHTAETIRQQHPDWPLERAAQAARSRQSARRSWDARHRIRHGDRTRSRLHSAAGANGAAAGANAVPPLQEAPAETPPPQLPPLAGAVARAPPARLSAAVVKPAGPPFGPHGSPNAAVDDAEPQHATAAALSQPAALPGIFCPALDRTPTPPSFPVGASEVLLHRMRSNSAGAGDPGQPDCNGSVPAGASEPVSSNSISASLTGLGAAAAAGPPAPRVRSLEQNFPSAAPAPAASAPAAATEVLQPSSAEDLGETILPGYFSLMRPAAAQPVLTQPAAAAGTADVRIPGKLPPANGSAQRRQLTSASEVFAEPRRRSIPVFREPRQAAGNQASPEPQAKLQPGPLPLSPSQCGRHAPRCRTDPVCTGSCSDGNESGVCSTLYQQLPRASAARDPDPGPSPPGGIRGAHETPQSIIINEISGLDSPPLRLPPRRTAGMNGAVALAPKAGSPAAQRQLSSGPSSTVVAASSHVSQAHTELEQLQEQLRQLDVQQAPSGEVTTVGSVVRSPPEVVATGEDVATVDPFAHSPPEMATEDPVALSPPATRPSAPAPSSELSHLTPAQTAVKDKVSRSAALLACDEQSKRQSCACSSVAIEVTCRYHALTNILFI